MTRRRATNAGSSGRVARRFAGLALCALALGGCGDKGPSPVPVAGTVKFKDGSVPQGEVAMVRFEPVTSVSTHPAALASLKPDGNFTLSTADGRPGALPGKYKVTLKIWKTYRPPHVSVVADKYVRQDSSPLDAEVTAEGANTFDFVVDPK